MLRRINVARTAASSFINVQESLFIPATLEVPILFRTSVTFYSLEEATSC